MLSKYICLWLLNYPRCNNKLNLFILSFLADSLILMSIFTFVVKEKHENGYNNNTITTTPNGCFRCTIVLENYPLALRLLSMLSFQLVIYFYLFSKSQVMCYVFNVCIRI
ncbi:hypothetical protein BDF14DRAFT_1836187 [Spinellus fusiger]|nr:hypothetical protein BDF14DRAFT_1836187 [Spinellus fusiger]